MKPASSNLDGKLHLHQLCGRPDFEINTFLALLFGIRLTFRLVLVFGKRSLGRLIFYFLTVIGLLEMERRSTYGMIGG